MLLKGKGSWVAPCLCVHLHSSPFQSPGVRQKVSQESHPRPGLRKGGKAQSCLNSEHSAGQGAEVGLLRAPPSVRFEFWPVGPNFQASQLQDPGLSC